VSGNNSSNSKEPRFTKTIKDDFKNLQVKDDLGKEYKDLKEYYLSEERKRKLESMGGCRKFFLIPWWMLKALFFKLTPFRRILLLFSIFMLLISGNNRIDSGNVTIDIIGPGIIGGLILLFILALELKDKLLAKTELEEGRAVQLALMPEQSPKVDGWDIWLYTRSANDVGGDLLDFIQIESDRFGIAVGDVAGKGLSAALLMSKLQSTIRALVYDSQSLSNLGKKLNTVFHRDSPSKIFASLLYSEIRRNFADIKFINAGHFPPIIIRTGQIEKMQKTAPALGIVHDADFNEQRISLQQDEFVIFYSDGLIEAINETGEFFGENRLLDALQNSQLNSSKHLGEFLISKVDDFVKKFPAHDDLTLAILKKV
jgi:sigma-B regulation protein RsbU (phosphoserine phosphatase)